MIGLGLNAVDFGVPNDGVTDAAPSLPNAIAAAFNAGHANLLLPMGRYLLSSPVNVDYPVNLIGSNFAAAFIANWTRSAGQAVFNVTGKNGAGGSMHDFTIWAAANTSGGAAIELGASSGVYGAHFYDLNRLYIGSGDPTGEWDWPIICEGRLNNDPTGAVGLRATSIRNCRLFNARYGYIYCAQVIQQWIENCGFYTPKSPAAIAAQPNSNFIGVATIDGPSSPCERVLLSNTPN